MDGRNIEPRIVLWATAEVCWEDQTGTANRASATLEDTSLSGACLRLKNPITVGSKILVKWHREQFSAIARNCRSDGREFLLGVRREATPMQTSPPTRGKPEQASTPRAPELSSVAPKEPPPASSARVQRAPAKPAGTQNEPAARGALPESAPACATTSAPAAIDHAPGDRAPRSRSNATSDARNSHTQLPTAQLPTVLQVDVIGRARSLTPNVPPPQERKAMRPKGFFPKFWRRPQKKLVSTRKPFG